MEKKLLVLGMAAMMAAGAANAELQAFKVNGETVSVAQQKALYDSAVAQGQPPGEERPHAADRPASGSQEGQA